MRWIYLSPHMDDAALCAGGLIHEQRRDGIDVEIWTLMCGVPETDELSDYALEMHEKWATTTARQTVLLRRKEDRRAAAGLGVKAVHFEFLDALYRRGPDGEPLYGDPVGAPVHPEDATLPTQLALAIESHLLADDVIVCPLGIGEHVDHVLVRQAAEGLMQHPSYVADVPYVINHPEDLEPKTIGLRAVLQPVSEAGLGAWLVAIEAYASQLSSLFDSRELLRDRIRSYWGAEEGIRMWSAQAARLGAAS